MKVELVIHCTAILFIICFKHKFCFWYVLFQLQDVILIRNYSVASYTMSSITGNVWVSDFFIRLPIINMALITSSKHPKTGFFDQFLDDTWTEYRIIPQPDALLPMENLNRLVFRYQLYNNSWGHAWYSNGSPCWSNGPLEILAGLYYLWN